MRTVLKWLAMSIAMAAWHVASAQQPPAQETVDLIVRTSIDIDRPAAAVWPVLVDLKAWKSSVGSLQHMSGEPEKEGELRFMTPMNATAQHGYLIQTMRVVPNRQLVLKLFPSDRAAFLGFAAFTLEESERKTRVTYDVYAEYRMGDMTAQQRSELAQQMHEDVKAKLEAENLQLKKLVEQRSRSQ